MTPSQLIAFLNAMSFGDIVLLHAKLEEARTACLALGQAELVLRLAEARTALGEGDVRTFRKKIETVVSRLGHLK